MKVKQYIAIILLLSPLSCVIDYPVFESNIIGTYVEKYSENIDYRRRERDTLYLRPNGKLYSKYWGNGTYRLMNYNEILLTPEKGKSITTRTYITNELFRQPKIWISDNANWEFYEKTEINN